MKRNAAIFLVWMWSAAAAEPLPRLITVEQAARVVWSFEGGEKFPLVYGGVSWGRNLYFWPIYGFSAASGRHKGAWYGVDPLEGRVAYYEARDSAVEHPGLTLDKMIAPDRAFQVACEAMGRQDPGFDPSTEWKILSSALDPPTWTPRAHYKRPASRVYFEFSRQLSTLDGRTVSDQGDYLIASVDALSGKLASYSRYRVPGGALPRHTVSEEKACRIALGALKHVASLQPTRHIVPSFQVCCAMVHKAAMSYEAVTDYPHCRIPIWYVTVIWSIGPPTLLDSLRECGGRETTIMVHGTTGEVLAFLHVFGTDTPSAAIDAEYREYYKRLPEASIPWTIRLGSAGVRAQIYPLPRVRGRQIWVKHSFAWLMGTRIQRTQGGYVLRGIEDIPVSGADVNLIDREPWFPLSRLAEASHAKVSMDLRERWLKIEPEYPGMF